MKYRPEIDGLRSVAVVPVILFHAGIAGFPGGYVGVDVFFVISGFLITSIIAAEMDKGSFSLLQFYERRVRRILPALFLVMLCTLPVAWMVLLPADMESFAKSLLAVVTFSSNILFWREDGYFAAAAELKPLLHTWSLAVEEQFYIFYPLLLMALWRVGRRAIVPILVLTFVVSLSLAEWGAHNKPSAAFYLLPTRAWELLIGAFAAFYLRRGAVPAPGLVANLLSGAGLVAIAVSVAVFDEGTPFPGLYALVPTVGTVLVILFAWPGTLACWLLRLWPLTAIGLISYSAYLWHQPLFAFVRYLELDLMWLAIGLTFVFSALSYRFVEQPFRVGGNSGFRISTAQLPWALGPVCAVITAFGLLNMVLDTRDWRFDPAQRAFIKTMEENRQYMATDAFDHTGCFFDHTETYKRLLENNCLKQAQGQSVFVFGDSESAHLMPGLRAAFANSDITFQQFTSTGCRNFLVGRKFKRCTDFYNAFFQELPKYARHGDIAVLGANWWRSHRSVGDTEFYEAVAVTVERLQAFGIAVVIVANTPDFPTDPYRTVFRRSLIAQDNLMLEARNYQPSNAVLQELAANKGLVYVQPTDLLCKANTCAFRKDSTFLYYDTGHLSDEGSIYVVNEVLAPVLQPLIARY